MYTKGGSFFTSPVRNLGTKQVGQRFLWTGFEYPLKHETQFLFTTNYFNSSTVRGNNFKDITKNPFSSLIWDNRIYDLLFRGMKEDESHEPINKKLGGIVGRKAHLLQHEDPLVVKQTLDEHQKGDIAGVSLSAKLRKGISFSALLGKGHELFMVDEQNILEKYRYKQDYSIQTALSSSGEPMDFSPEHETTPPALHRSSAVCRVRRDGWNISIDYNPLYVDQNILTEPLKKEYHGVLTKFYKITSFIRKGDELSPSQEKLISEYKDTQRKFYLNMIEKLEGTPYAFDESRQKAIVDELTKNTVLEIEYEPKEEEPKVEAEEDQDKRPFV